MLLILLMCILIFLIVVVLFLIGMFFSMKLKYLRSQGTPFECGFENFSSSRMPFSLHFYLVAMLFLVFDIEIIYLMSFVITVKVTSVSMWVFSVLIILLILFLGLEYEKRAGSLIWVI